MRITIALITLLAIQATPAEPGPIQTSDQLLTGQGADGQIGDLRLESEGAAYIFSALDHGLHREAVGGALIDVGLREVGQDLLGEMRTAYGPGTGRLAQNTAIRLSDDRQAVIVEGIDATDDRITIATAYHLGEGFEGLTITTTITNGTDASLEAWEIGDRVRWGSSRIFLMDRGPLFHQAVQASTRATILFGEDWSAAITVGDNRIMGVRRHREHMVLAHSRDDIQPGESIETTRHLVLGRESMHTIAEALWELNGLPHGTLRGEIVEQGTQTPIANAELLINLRGERPTPLLRVLTDEQGEFAVEVPAGVRVIGFPRSFSRTQPTQVVYPAVIEEGGEAYQQYLLNPPARINLRVTEGNVSAERLLPVRVALYDLNGAPADLGPVGGMPAAGPYLFVPDGQGIFEVPVGQYRMTISHGPEHDQWEQEVIFFSGRTREFEVTLDRLIETPHQIAADFGVLTNHSPEGMVDPVARAIAAACAGLEFIVATDSGHVTDLQAALDEADRDLPLTAEMGERIPPNEDGSLGTHAVFPVPAQYAGTSLLQGENPSTPGALIQSLRERLPGALVATLSPSRAGQSQFLAHGYAYDRSTRDFTAATRMDAGAMDFDLFEVMGDFNFDHVRQDLDLAYALMREGHQFAFIGSANSRYNGLEEIGHIRTMVACPEPAEGSSRIDAADIYEGLRRRHTTVTSGPLVDVSILGHRPGDLFTWEAGEPIEVEITLQATEQFHLSYLDINKRGTFVQRHTFLRPAQDRVRNWAPEGGSTRLMVRQDDFINIEVAGGRAITPLHPANDVGPGFVPFAVTTPIWIDTDGNGRYDHTADPDFE